MIALSAEVGLHLPEHDRVQCKRQNIYRQRHGRLQVSLVRLMLLYAVCAITAASGFYMYRQWTMGSTVFILFTLAAPPLTVVFISLLRAACRWP